VSRQFDCQECSFGPGACEEHVDRLTRVLVGGFDHAKGAAEEFEFASEFVPRSGDIIWREPQEEHWHVTGPARFYPSRGYVRVTAERFK
jgi:hypothetical protein